MSSDEPAYDINARSLLHPLSGFERFIGQRDVVVTCINVNQYMYIYIYVYMSKKWRRTDLGVHVGVWWKHILLELSQEIAWCTVFTLHVVAFSVDVATNCRGALPHDLCKVASSLLYIISLA